MAPKPGIATTEFWMHLILQVILILNTVGVWDYMPPKYTVLVQGILGAAATTAVYPIEPPGDTTEAQ
jgi:hypothetical protein